jgi:PPP family 3-phenylpropionic acid transporter
MQVSSIGILFAFEAVRMKDRGVGETAIGIILGISSGVFILGSLFWGRLADHGHWHKKIAIWGSLAFFFLLIYFSMCVSVWDFLIYAILKSMAAPMVFGMMPALAVKAMGPHRQGRKFGIYRAFGSLGFIIGAMGLPLLFNDIGIVARVGAVIILSSIFLLLQLPETEIDPAPGVPLRIRQLHPAIKLFLASFFFIAMTEPAVQGFFSAYARHLGGSTRLLGMLFGSMGFIALLFLPLMGRWIDHANPTFILSIAFLAQPLRVFLTSCIDQPEMLWVPLLLHGICWGGVEVAAIVYLSSLAKENQKATVLSFYIAMRMLGNLVGASISGYLAENFGYIPMFQSMTLVALFGAMSYIVGVYLMERKPQAGNGDER